MSEPKKEAYADIFDVLRDYEPVKPKVKLRDCERRLNSTISSTRRTASVWITESSNSKDNSWSSPKTSKLSLKKSVAWMVAPSAGSKWRRISGKVKRLIYFAT